MAIGDRDVFNEVYFIKLGISFQTKLGGWYGMMILRGLEPEGCFWPAPFFAAVMGFLQVALRADNVRLKFWRRIHSREELASRARWDKIHRAECGVGGFTSGEVLSSRMVRFLGSPFPAGWLFFSHQMPSIITGRSRSAPQLESTFGARAEKASCFS